MTRVSDTQPGGSPLAEKIRQVVFDSFPKLYSFLEMVQTKVLFSKNCFADYFIVPGSHGEDKLSYCFCFSFVQVFAE